MATLGYDALCLSHQIHILRLADIHFLWPMAMNDSELKPPSDLLWLIFIELARI